MLSSADRWILQYSRFCEYVTLYYCCSIRVVHRRAQHIQLFCIVSRHAFMSNNPKRVNFHVIIYSRDYELKQHSRRSLSLTLCRCRRR